ncbi:MAG: hypothetical protein KDE27_18840 [Planctomycetes bacterium]|nr:hypothetical protein [Planctomycetota bacterium]
MSKTMKAAGFSMIELTIASVLLFVMLYSVAALSLSGADASDLSRRLTRAAEVSQEIVNDTRLEIVSSVRLFGDDAEGNANLARLDLSGAMPQLASSRLPTIDANGTIGADTVGNEITGNSLFFCKLAWSDRFVCLSGNEYLVDVLRWVYIYLTPESGGAQVGSPVGLNLVRVVSEPLIDAGSVDRISDPVDQAEVLMHLLNATPDANGVTHLPCEIVWMRGELPSATDAIRQIDPSDGSLSSTPIGGRASPFEIVRRDDEVEGMLYYRHHSVATNYSPPSYGVATFGIPSATNGGFPHGFEVQITGPSSARQVLVHLVVASTNNHGHKAYNDVQIVVDARDT